MAVPWESDGFFRKRRTDSRATEPARSAAEVSTPTPRVETTPDGAVLADIEYVSGNYLRGRDVAREVQAAREAGACTFLRVKEYLRREWPDAEVPLRNEMTDVLIGLHQLGRPLVFLLRGREREVGIYYGFPGDAIGYLQATLENAYAEISLFDEGTADDLTSGAGEVYVGISCGLPSELRNKDFSLLEQIERLIRGLYGEEYFLAVRAIPVTDETLEEMSRFISQRLLVLRTECERLPWEQARMLVGMYRKTNEIVEDCRRLGGWSVSVTYASASKETAQKVASYVRGIYSGRQSYPTPLRTFSLPGRKEARDIFALQDRTYPGHVGTVQRGFLATLMDSGRVSVLCRLPRAEFPGFRVGRGACFDVHHECDSTDNVELGNITMGNRDTGNRLLFPVPDLARHVLVAGVTGSGKTNTCMSLIRQLASREKPVPFMVIESAKAAYRNLLNDAVLGEKLRVFSLADETTSHFRMNPFEFPEGSSLQSYINSIYALFNAAFILYAPMPYVLYQSLHEIYRDKGWNLLLGVNECGDRSPYAFPTLTDLYVKVEEVVDSLGYEQRITMDVKAALKTRINSLRMGAKGVMLDTHASIPMRELMEYPTVIELERIGDDEEKAFIMGLLLIKLFEYQKNKGESGGELRHVTLIEEAHRLLKKVPMEFSTEVSNTRGKALETFCNILSESRAYGEGIIIAEQIPSKLIPDAVKNTNLKVIHRLVDFEERELVGKATNMEEQQRAHLSVLPRGMAVCHYEGLDLPIMVKVPLVVDQLGWDAGDLAEKVRESSRMAEGSQRLRYRYGACVDRCLKPCQLLDAARDFAEDPAFVSRFLSSMFVVLSEQDPGHVQRDIFELLVNDVKRKSGGGDGEGLIFCALLNCFHSFLMRASKGLRLGYGRLEEAEEVFAEALIPYAERGLYSEKFGDIAAKLKEVFGKAARPSDLCFHICGERGCFFRMFVREICVSGAFSRWVDIYRGGRERELYDFTLELVRDAWPALFSVKAKETIRKLALCLTYNMLSDYGATMSAQQHRIERFLSQYPWEILEV